MWCAPSARRAESTDTPAAGVHAARVEQLTVLLTGHLARNPAWCCVRERLTGMRSSGESIGSVKMRATEVDARPDRRCSFVRWNRVRWIFPGAPAPNLAHSGLPSTTPTRVRRDAAAGLSQRLKENGHP